MSFTNKHPAGRGTILVTPTKTLDDSPKTSITQTNKLPETIHETDMTKNKDESK